MAAIDIDKVFSQLDKNTSLYVDRLRASVAIESVSAERNRRPECLKMAQWTKQLLETFGAECSLVPLGSHNPPDNLGPLDLPPMLLAQLGSDPSKKTLLVYGHLDVQPAEKSDGWNTEPFELTEIDGKMFGRGSTDDKGPVLAWINAIQAFQQCGYELPVNLKFCLESMEESGSVGLEEALTKLKDTFLKDVDYACISDNYWLGKKKPCLTYGLSHEAMVDLIHIMNNLVGFDGKILVPGLNELVDPLTEQEKKLYDDIDFDVDEFTKDIGASKLRHASKQDVLMHRWRYPSLSLHGIEGAFSSPGCKTVIPRKVTGKFSIRIVPNMQTAEVEKLVVKYVNELFAKTGSPNKLRLSLYLFKGVVGGLVKGTGDNKSATTSDNKKKVYNEHSGMWWLSDPKHPNYQAGRNAIQKVFQTSPDMTREGGSIPPALCIQELTKKSVLLLPIGACDDGAHAQNEKLDRANYVNGGKVLAAYMLEVSKL